MINLAKLILIWTKLGRIVSRPLKNMNTEITIKIDSPQEEQERLGAFTDDDGQPLHIAINSNEIMEVLVHLLARYYK